MIEFRRGKKNKSFNNLFNPYKNGISSYDVAYLSSKRIISKNKNVNLQNIIREEFSSA
tara:strand:+ start:229 stop:402 length:174 start_codon:yes stop_codon:yes gene_type:complete